MKKTALIAASLLFIGVGCANLFGQAPRQAPPGGGPGGGMLNAEQKSSCGITASVTEGPYFVSDTAALKNGELNYTGLPGNPLKITGHVYQGLDDSKPLADA